MQTKHRVLAVVDQLLTEGQAVLGTKWAKTRLGNIPISNPTSYVDVQAFAKWQAGCRNLVRLLGDQASHWESEFTGDSNQLIRVKRMVGTLQAIRQAVDQDLLVTVEDIVMAEAFTNLREQADYLHSEGYVLAAGVIGRAVLEEHLRKWCQHTGCMPAKPRPTLSDLCGELYKTHHLSKIELKLVDSMTAVGNAAAHAQPVGKDDVGRFLRDLSDFVESHPLSQATHNRPAA